LLLLEFSMIAWWAHCVCNQLSLLMNQLFIWRCSITVLVLNRNFTVRAKSALDTKRQVKILIVQTAMGFMALNYKPCTIQHHLTRTRAAVQQGVERIGVGCYASSTANAYQRHCWNWSDCRGCGKLDVQVYCRSLDRTRLMILILHQVAQRYFSSSTHKPDKLIRWNSKQPPLSSRASNAILLPSEIIKALINNLFSSNTASRTRLTQLLTQHVKLSTICPISCSVLCALARLYSVVQSIRFNQGDKSRTARFLD